MFKKKPGIGGLSAISKPTTSTGGASFVNVDVTYNGKTKRLACSKKWDNNQIIEDIADKFSLEISKLDPDSLIINLDKGEGPNNVDDFSELKDGNKVIIEISEKKESAEKPVPMKTGMSKPKLNMSKPVVK